MKFIKAFFDKLMVDDGVDSFERFMLVTLLGEKWSMLEASLLDMLRRWQHHSHGLGLAQ